MFASAFSNSACELTDSDAIFVLCEQAMPITSVSSRGSYSATSSRSSVTNGKAGSGKKLPSLATMMASCVHVSPSRIFSRRASTCEPVRSISPVNVPKQSVSIINTSGNMPKAVLRIGRITCSLPCLEAITARRPSNGCVFARSGLCARITGLGRVRIRGCRRIRKVPRSL